MLKLLRPLRIYRYIVFGNALVAHYGSDVAAGELPSTVGLNGTIRIDGAGSTLTFNQGGSEFVGRNGGRGAIYLQNGSTGNSIRGPLGLADSPSANSSGLLSITQGSAVSLTFDLTMANRGVVGQTATLNVNGLDSSLTQLPAGSITIGSGSDGFGTATINVGTDATGGTFNTGTGQITINRTGTVNVGAGTYVGTFNANGPVSISGGKLVIGAGSKFNVAPQHGLTLGGQGSIQGSGIVKGDVYMYNGGVVAPGSPVGTLTLDGDINQSQNQGGQVAIELGGTAPGTFDRLVVTGRATFTSMLKISLVGGFKPVLGDSFRIFNWGQHSGKFSSFQFPGFGNAALAWNTSELYTTGAVTVVATPGGDFNHNGVVDAADYTLWRDMLGRTGAGLAADSDHDGVVDIDDYNDWKSHFGQTLVYGSNQQGGQGAVSEPGASLLICVGASGLIMRRRVRKPCVGRI